MPQASTRLVLASTSATRIAMLHAAGLRFESRAPGVDESTVTHADPAALASLLASRKAMAVAAGKPDALVIGADQTLECDGRLYGKPPTRGAARDQLAALAGRTHRLHSAVAVCRGGHVDWRHRATVALSMRPLAAAEIERYLDRVGAAALASVGAYQVEGLGIQLFDRIDGDWFAILGLPLLPLLAYLRNNAGVGL